MSGELSSTKDPILMKMFLLKRNNRSKIPDVVISGGLVNDDFIQMRFIIFFQLSIAMYFHPADWGTLI